MIRQISHSLRGRILLSSLLVSILILCAVIGNSIHLAGRYLEMQSREATTEIGKSYTAAILPYLMTQDYATLRDVLQEWGEARHIDYLIVRDLDGRLVSVAWSDEKPLPVSGLYDGILHEIIPIKVGEQVYGQLYIGRNTQFIEEARLGFFFQNALIAVVGLLFLILLQSFLVYYLMRGLSALSDASIKIARGDLRQRVQVYGQDEIAVLANSFNTMIDTIQNRVHELEASEWRFRTIANYTYSWESWFGTEGELKWVNPAVQRLTGYTPEECMVMADYPLALVHEADRDLVSHMMQQAGDGHSGQDLEFRVQCRNNRTIWVAISWQAVHDDSGNSLGFRVSIRDITLQHYANEELAYQAVHDPLTGLHNRRAFERQLQKELEASQKDGKPLVVLYLDLDQFKVVNDTCGHSVGDQLLINLAKVLQSKHSDCFLARLGGDEFGILLRDCDEKEAVARANALIDEIRTYPFVYGGQSFRMGASVGVVRAAQGLDNFTSLLVAADTACYAAKEHGRNRVEVYTEEDEYFRLRNEEFRSVGHITTALTEGRFILYFQYVEPLRPDLPRHAEILLRLRDFLGNIQAPGRFIAAAERFNMMPYIDRWVVENVCSQIAEWDKAGIKPDVTKFAVNVSGASLSDRDFPGFVQEQISKYGIDPGRLGFEITESCAVGQLDQAMGFIDRMHQLQSSLSLDDFGSGMASFAYLKRFKVDYLKIDGMFVKNLHMDSADGAVVRSMVQLAKAYNLKVVAEFVSNESIYEIIKGLGVDYAQGYACHVPEPLVNMGKHYPPEGERNGTHG
ncbi:MAG: EAL domain-containing protein [Zoogloeaceae bacterium]|jgi:diguanylate cyclase (GGDEF)-like protein/PAS domain S-box-containing protein|nr:EAL domain-containing protein [Zoogloeaceae bacterium]